MMEGNFPFISSITNEEINLLPTGSYQGEIVLIEDEVSAINAALEIKEFQVLGFDTESKPAFKKGEINPVALIQLATPEKVYLFRNLKCGIPKELLQVFENPNITKVGVALRDDIKDIQKLAPFRPNGFLDLQHIVGKIGIQHLGLKSITAIILGFRISKKMQVTNWEASKLDLQQMNYAATDSWVCLEIYQKLLPFELW